eukprot:2167811-Prymnesium_polylepis.1
MSARAMATITASVEANIRRAQQGRKSHEALDLTGGEADGFKLSKKERQLIKQERERDAGGG